ncbi:FxSxx-COOH system tetratricopeptide repeat protein [Streptomyces goshikiensis]|uniref:FxSxx-COOH system tetratricopeptide repeat protein n=1 Tax=Streptomyces goshikiensis TaxID=1942 RepID=UPI0036642220
MARANKGWRGTQQEETPAVVTVTGTGDAVASFGGTAVSGFRGLAVGTDQAGEGPVSVSSTGDATAIGGGFANAGYIGTLTVQAREPQEPALWPHQVGLIPPAARSFQLRGEADRLRMTVDGGGTAVLTQLLTGMGGVGKTQLAADYARTAWKDAGTSRSLDVLVWIAAHTRQAIVTGYGQAGVELCRADPNDAEQAARSFLAWLAPKSAARPCRWLIVLDDVSDPADLRGLWPPDSLHGRTLVTTRRRDAALAADGRRTVEVGLFTEAEALSYLTASLTGHRRDHHADQLSALAGDLGHLPLALAQAAAYINDAGESAASYRQLLANRTTTLADTAPEALPDDQALPLNAAWSLSIDRADTLRPAGLARPTLQLIALLESSGIPQTVLTSEPALAYLTAHRTRTGLDPADEPAPVSAQDAARALRALHRLSLIDHIPQTPHRAIRVHQLIQRATRDALTPRQHEQATRAAADALIAAWPTTERDTDLGQALRTNTTALTKSAGITLYRPDVHTVLFRTGASLGYFGQVTAARDHYSQLSHIARQQLGPDHPDTLAARGSLARWQGESGDALGARDAFAELLEHAVRVLGEGHRHVLATRDNLARWQGEAGDASGAATAFAELLADRVRILGEDHRHVLATRNSLAQWRGRAGDASGAGIAFAELLADRVQTLGEDHPDTLVTRDNIARWRGETGDASGAASAFAELLADRVRVLGEDHPHTLTSRGNLARWRGEAGDAVGARDAFAELLEQMVQVLGQDHPDTLVTRSNLARWRGTAGDASGAVTAFAELLADRVRVLGEDHPQTLATRANLARWQGEAGDAVGARDAFAELQEHKTRVLGKDHPQTLVTREDLARWRGMAGDASGAATAFAELLADRVRVLGEDHLHSLVTRDNIARCRGELGDAAGAVAAFAELLADRVRVLGEDHPHTMATRSKLARWQRQVAAEQRGEQGALPG